KKSKKLDIEFAEEIISRKLLAHTCGIAGQSTIKDKNGKKFSFNLEYFFDDITIKSISDSLSAFSSSKELLPVEKEYLKTMKEAYDFSLNDPSSSEIVARIQKDKPVFMSLNAEQHYISVVFFKDKLIVCNRGQVSTPNTT